MAKDNKTRFYERYWQKPEEAPPAGDPTTVIRLKLFFQETKGRTNLKILDAGCGDGFFTSQLRKARHQAVGIDISERVIAQARERGAEFIVLPLESRYPFEDATFDVIFSSEVIEHLLDVAVVFKEWNRVLKPNGLLVLTTPYHGFIKNLLIVCFNFKRHFNVEGPHIRFFTPIILKNLLYEHGFKAVSLRYYGRFWPIAKGMFIIARKIRNVING